MADGADRPERPGGGSPESCVLIVTVRPIARRELTDVEVRISFMRCDRGDYWRLRSSPWPGDGKRWNLAGDTPDEALARLVTLTTAEAVYDNDRGASDPTHVVVGVRGRDDFGWGGAATPGVPVGPVILGCQDCGSTLRGPTIATLRRGPWRRDEDGTILECLLCHCSASGVTPDSYKLAVPHEEMGPAFVLIEAHGAVAPCELFAMTPNFFIARGGGKIARTGPSAGVEHGTGEWRLTEPELARAEAWARGLTR